MKKGPPNFHSLLHSADLVEKNLSTLLSSVGLRPKQARVINVLKRLGTASQVELAEWFGVTAASMSTMIDRLLAAKFVVRHKNPADQRIDVVALTPQGEALVEEIRCVWRDVDKLIIAAIGEEKAEQLTALTRELKTALGGKVIGKDMPERNLKALIRELKEQQKKEGSK